MIERTYKDIEERDNIVADLESQGFVLREEKNITEGNFLIFATIEELQPKPTQDDYLLDLDFRSSMIELGL
ncbi:hypothetical protein [Desulfosporosinus shakirovi]|uniref:hypothetical protein n=1 Tax=Desulfosporosinus shakirovi TaxID=2885154 RepID=UPI001E64E6CB|nr:hypothetical protein [Desulfosporosinus sp. SRJS8]MCB8816136.1 hypothetical protein [Desulfosporosinus sp. SRJS8]